MRVNPIPYWNEASLMARYVSEGGSPGRWYATAYKDFDKEVRVAYPIGIHLLVRWSRDLLYWIKLVGRPGYRERLEHEWFFKGYKTAQKRYSHNVP